MLEWLAPATSYSLEGYSTSAAPATSYSLEGYSTADREICASGVLSTFANALLNDFSRADQIAARGR